MSIGGYMAWTLYIGAAWYDATPEQRVRIRAQTMPLVEEARDETTNPARWNQLAEMIIYKVTDIMGPNWEGPTGEWNEQIKRMLSENRQPG